MSDFDSFANTIYFWVTRYIAVFCLVSIALWGIGMFLWSKVWRIKVRDAAIYLLTIGLLATLLVLRPEKTDGFFWPALTWFCFTMLAVFEVLWLVYLVDSVLRAIFNAATPQHLPTSRHAARQHPPHLP